MMDPVDLLFHFSPRPHVTVMTGVCCANEGEANLGDIVVVTPQNDLLHFFAELQHVMELWTIKEKIKLPPADIQQPSGLYTELQVGSF